MSERVCVQIQVPTEKEGHASADTHMSLQHNGEVRVRRAFWVHNGRPLIRTSKSGPKLL